MEISIEDASDKFTHHINQNKNERIIFSGKFGTGKSHFLKKYFEERENEYNVFWISPVNYVVGANQDIFEWIKVDIAKELLSNYLISEDDKNIPKNILLQTYVYNNAGSIFSRLMLSFANGVGKNITGIDFVDCFRKEIDEFKKFADATKHENDEAFKNKLEEFLKNALQITGSIYEDDLTTRAIRAAIGFLKFSSPDKKNVLIIDDLDRLDPEHIFRILNILSAHNDHFDSNKFGFDKVIVVCDLDNIQHLYAYRYGEADFEGYIEKFYTYEPFHFSINQAIVDYCNNVLLKEELDEANRTVLALLLVYFHERERIKIRNIKKITFERIEKTLKIDVKKYTLEPVPKVVFGPDIIQSNDFEIDYNSFGIIKTIYLLSIVFGGFNNLKKAITQDVITGVFFDSKYLNHVTQSVGIAAHIAKSNPNMVKTYFSLEVNNRKQFPLTNFLSKDMLVRFKWSAKNPYIEGNFFENAKLEMPPEDQSIQIIRQGSLDQEKELLRQLCSYHFLLNEINHIINLIFKEHLLPNINI